MPINNHENMINNLENSKYAFNKYKGGTNNNINITKKTILGLIV